jgi:prepilin-type N-terminal cleavage/methylation domain-containing protein
LDKQNQAYTLQTSGFTLVEISVVLIIIGLVVSGILVGRDLIASAENNKIARSLESYKTAFYTFKLKYNAIPGDMLVPSQYWPEIIPRGNGNGIIDVWTNESALAWRELSAAGLVNVDVNEAAPHYANSPVSTQNAVAIWFNNDFHMPMAGRYGNTIAIFKQGVIDADAQTILSSIATSQIDRKIDDGYPLSGRFYGLPDVTGGISPVDGCSNSLATPPNYHLGTSPQGNCRIVYFVD